jgi:glycosyltransferase involved in cell wall biosynthesis
MEVSGGAAIHAGSAAAIAEAMRAVAGKPELRQKMSADGLDRAAGYSWARTARETRAIYAEILSSR